MDEYEKRMFHKAAIDSLVSIVIAFKPDLLTTGKEKIVQDELFQRYAQKWVNMAYDFLDKANALGSGYADYAIDLLGLKVAVAKPQPTP